MPKLKNKLKHNIRTNEVKWTKIKKQISSVIKLKSFTKNMKDQLELKASCE